MENYAKSFAMQRALSQVIHCTGATKDAIASGAGIAISGIVSA
jgi:hypothetical protein